MLKQFAAALLAVVALHGTASARDDRGRPTLPEQAAPAAHGAVAKSGAVKVTATLTAPADGASYTAPAQVVLSADATSKYKNHPVTEVRFYQGSTLIATRTQAPYSFTWSNVLAGNYQLSVQAINAKGDSATSAPVAINVNDPPAISLAAPADGARATAPASFQLTAAASDSDGSIASVEFYNGTSLLATITAAPYQFDSDAIPAGSYTLTARATDNQGASTTSRPVLLHVNAPPTVSLTAPAEGAKFIAPGTVLLAAEAADSDGSIQTVKFFHGTTEIGSVTDTPYLFAWNPEPGTYAITGRAIDNEGATAGTETVNITVVPNQMPSVSVSANPQTGSAPATIELTADASDVDGTIAEVSFYNDDTLLATINQAPFQYTWNEVPEGSYSITARATDNLGGSTTSVPHAVTITSGQAKVYYIEADHLNTPRVITDQNNTVVWKWDNDDPFGNNVPNEDADNNGQQFEFNLRFPGQYFDRETGLHYNYFRDYDPGTGRYVQSDPIGLMAGPNTYAYVEGNPLMYSDPLGLQPGDGGGRYGPVTNTIVNFVQNYRDMREANTIGADKYFHCMANCQSARRQGPIGYGLSKGLSESRELFDEYVKGDSPEACNADRDANDTGREGGANNPEIPCPVVCGGYRPDGLPSKY